MKRITSIFLLLVAGMASAPGLISRSQQKPEELGQKSAEAWLALTDSGKYAQSWQEAATAFKAAVTQEQWVKMVAPVRNPLGKVLSRTLKSATYTKEIPNAPVGEYVVIQYNTNFENKKDSVETVTPMLDKDGKWRVSGYYIK